jgi:cytochrome P450
MEAITVRAGARSIAQPLASLPLLALTADDERAGRIAALQAAASEADGTVVHASVPSGLMAGPCACLVGAAALDFAYGEGRDALSSARGYRPLIGRRFGIAVLNADDPQHLRQRRAWAPGFATAALDRALAPLDALVFRRIESWLAAGTIDAYAAARELAFAVAATAGAGLPDDERTAALGRAFADVLAPPAEGEDVHGHHVRVGPLRDDIERTLAAHCERLVRDRAANVPGIAGMLVRNDPSLAANALLEHVNLLLVAGHETAASLLAWTLVIAAAHPGLAENVATDVPARQAAPAQVVAMPALDALVAEIGRLHPPLCNAPRVAAREFVHAGVRIAAGTTVALAIGATHRLAAHFAEADAIRPERFLRGSRIGGGRPSAGVYTFGSGARLCLGMRLAQATVKLALGRLLQRARLVRPAGPCVNAGFWNARPRGELRLALAPR